MLGRVRRGEEKTKASTSGGINGGVNGASYSISYIYSSFTVDPISSKVI